MERRAALLRIIRCPSSGSIRVKSLKALGSNGYSIRTQAPIHFTQESPLTELTKKTTGFLAEFRQFIARGNVLDMAVGVIIGGAFGKISTSLVNDILMPLLSLLTGGADFSQWQWVLREAVYDAGGSEVRAAVAINYGSFLSTILDFLIIAFGVFCLIKAINRFHRKKEAAPPPPPQPSQEEVLLAEIRDLLKERT